MHLRTTRYVFIDRFLEETAYLYRKYVMTREAIETAKKEGIPFAIKRADGREYQVDRSEQIHLAKTHVVVIDQQTHSQILPLLTITGLSYLKQPSRRKSSGNE